MNKIQGFIRKAAGRKSPPPFPPLRRKMDELQIVAEGTISCTPESSSSLQVHQRIQSRADAERPDGDYECGSPRTLAFGKVGET